MKDIIKESLKKITKPSVLASDVIPWSSPVPFFGKAQNASIATVGINPSNREFMDQFGRELTGPERRFSTLGSLGLDRWSDAKDRDLEELLDGCCNYFHKRPYELWFNKLETIASQTRASYYAESNPLCHLDLVPYATSEKWASLDGKKKKALLEATNDLLLRVIESSNIELLILNGRSVAEVTSRSLGIDLDSTHIAKFDLMRTTSTNVIGIGYTGLITKIRNRKINRKIRVLGFNHNIQSSFGITTSVIKNISNWIGLNH